MNLKYVIKQFLKRTSIYKFLRSKKYSVLDFFEKKRCASSENKYTIVSAVYNVEKYLEKYFKTITNQTLKFEKHIHIIMVDDGSTDNSAEIIHKWQKKYPNNIRYIKKENGGQASARNLGLEFIKTEWVTFIDPDDFIDKRYFEKVDKTVKKYHDSDLAMIGCNIQYYFEKLKLYLNRHPLKYRFQNGNSHYVIKNLNKNIQLSASTAFFKTNLIKAAQLKFDIRIKPNFEDAHFVNRYLLTYHQNSIYFLKFAFYYYRKRKSKGSALDTAWNQQGLYNDVLSLGCLNLFHEAKNIMGYVPVFLQHTILYHLAWYFRTLMNCPEKTEFLSMEEQFKFHTLVKILFKDIDLSTIENFELVHTGFFEKYGWTSQYKETILPYQCIFAIKNKTHIELTYISKKLQNTNIVLNNVKINLTFSLKQKHTFVNQLFVNEYILKLPINQDHQTLTVEIDSLPVYICSGKTKIKHIINIANIETEREKKLKIIFHNYARKLLIG